MDHELQNTIRDNLYLRTVPVTTRAPRPNEVSNGAPRDQLGCATLDPSAHFLDPKLSRTSVAVSRGRTRSLYPRQVRLPSHLGAIDVVLFRSGNASNPPNKCDIATVRPREQMRLRPPTVLTNLRGRSFFCCRGSEGWSGRETRYCGGNPIPAALNAPASRVPCLVRVISGHSASE